MRSLGSATIRSYRPGDEAQLALLYSEYLAGYVGPFRLTPEEWLAQWRPSWRAQGLEADPDSVRIAERDGRIVGYAAADHGEAECTMLHQLCVTDEAEASDVVRLLLEDVERIAFARDKLMVISELSEDDGLARRAAEAAGYEFGLGGATFMTLITDLVRFLTELAPELARRLTASEFATWQGEVTLHSGDLEAALRLREGEVRVERPAGAPSTEDVMSYLRQPPRAAVGRATPLISTEIAPERLPLLLLGRCSVGEAYLWDELTVVARDRREALRLLDVLFPPLPLFLPRTQWW